MNTENLKLMRDVLLNVIEQHKPFDMGVWQKDSGDCGSAACAMGWAARDERFKDLGLSITDSGVPKYKDSLDFFAVASLFEMSTFDVGFLFDSSMYLKEDVTAEDVIGRIDEVIRNPDASKKWLLEYLDEEEELRENTTTFD